MSAYSVFDLFKFLYKSFDIGREYIQGRAVFFPSTFVPN